MARFLLYSTNGMSFIYSKVTSELLFIGYIGDRIGYRIVLVVNLIIAGLTATSFDWTPRFVEHYRTPTISFNTTSDIPEVLQFQWAPNDCNMNNITVDYCENDEILLNEDFWLNLDVFSNCSMTNSSSVALEDIPEFLCKYFLL